MASSANAEVDHRISLPKSGSAASVDVVIDKARILNSQLSDYVKFLAKHKEEQHVETGIIRSSVTKELESLERVKKILESDDPEKNEALQTLRSTNIGYHLTVWETAKYCAGVLTFQKRVYWETTTRDTKKEDKSRRGATVDIIAEDGAAWIKVSTVTEHRLALELAEKGYGDSDDEGEEPPLDEDDMVEIVKAAHDLRKASQATRVRYKHPKIRFILPKIKPGHTTQVDNILNQIRATGATVECGQSSASQPLVPLNTLFTSMLPMASYALTPTVNVDCTILLALISDLSYYDADLILHEAEARAPGGKLHAAVIRQLQKEVEEQLLPKVLYPLLRGRDLVCTQEAATRMREIVRDIGTESEKERMAIVMGDHASEDAEDRHGKLNALATHAVPDTLRLPIKTVQANIDLAGLPPVAAKVAEHFDCTRGSAITQSVFMYGWQSSQTTITSNRTAAKGVEDIIHKYTDTNDEGSGPGFYIVSTARSLVGKEKRRMVGAKMEEDAAQENEKEEKKLAEETTTTKIEGNDALGTENEDENEKKTLVKNLKDMRLA